MMKSTEKAYFVRGGPRGVTFGPKTPGKDDHVTVGIDGGDFSQAHRKINGHEDWRVTPESIQAEVDSLVVNNVKTMEFANLKEPGTYVVSLNRLRLLFEFPQTVLSILMPLLWRLIATSKEVKTGTGRRFELSIEQKKVRHLIARSRGPLSILGKFMKRLPPKVPLQILSIIFGWVRVHPQTPDRLKDDLFLIVSKDHTGLIWRAESDSLQYLALGPLIELYARAERSLPLGKLSEIGNDWTRDVTLTGRAW